jgi:hypothetical protein
MLLVERKSSARPWPGLLQVAGLLHGLIVLPGTTVSIAADQNGDGPGGASGFLSSAIVKVDS